MSKSIYCLLFICCLAAGCGKKKTTVPQSGIIIDSATSVKNEFATYDQSPMDISYFPAGYPLQKMAGKDTTGGPLARVVYSRPHKKGRKIFGDDAKSLCVYGKPWRLGANESTEIEFFIDATIAGKTISKGRYNMYCIPFADHWTIVLNSNLYTWGLHVVPEKDVLRTDVKTLNLTPALEDFTMVFLPADNGTELLMAWDNVKALLPISFSFK